MSIIFQIMGVFIFGSLNYLLLPINKKIKLTKEFLSLLTMAFGTISIISLKELYTSGVLLTMLDSFPSEIGEFVGYFVVLAMLLLTIYVILPLDFKRGER